MKTVVQLKAEAKALGLKGYSKLRKAELIEFILSATGAKKCPEGKSLNLKTNRCLKNCKAHQTRNPNTNRCKKDAIISKARTAKEKSSSKILLGSGASGKVYLVDNLYNH